MNVGDYGCVRTSGWVGWAIRVVTRSKVNHSFVYVGDGKIVEAQPRGAVLSLASDYPDAHWHAAPPDRGAVIADHARRLIGTPYGFADIASVGLLQYGIKPFALRAYVQRQDRLICSQLVDLAYMQAGIHLFADGRWVGDCTPGDLDRLPAQITDAGTKDCP